MKFFVDERSKHRLTGVIVILSIAAIFVPALMKKSNQKLEESMNISVRLPSKPNIPSVLMSSEKAMFKTVKVAKVDVPRPSDSFNTIQVVKAQRISPPPVMVSVLPALKKEKVMAKMDLVTPTIKAAREKVRVAQERNIMLKAQTLASKKEIYSVQLASFSQLSNAESLVERLRQQGYKASYSKFTTKQGGEFYKVVVGQLNQKNEAQNLQKKLASSIQLNGFVIKQELS